MSSWGEGQQQYSMTCQERLQTEKQSLLSRLAVYKQIYDGAKKNVKYIFHAAKSREYQM